MKSYNNTLSMKYQTRKKALVLLADGTIFYGKSVGIEGTATGEICFNTGMTGYQEIFTDPSYFGQIMVTTNAHIGNYGVNDEEVESDGIKISGLVCRNFSFTHSRVDSDGNLKDWFTKHNLVAISDVDTRALTSIIREKGMQHAVIAHNSEGVFDIDALKSKHLNGKASKEPIWQKMSPLMKIMNGQKQNGFGTKVTEI